MTNTRMTDPEVLELRYPVRLEHFAIRHGSGGDRQMARRRRRDPPHPLPGADDGGHRFIAPQGRPVRPGRRRGRRRRAAMGGARRMAAHDILTGTDRAELAPGDVFVIETPGGGGYGRA